MADTGEPRLAAILLAAGESRRLGVFKQLVRKDGESLVRRAARFLVAQKITPVVVVTGCRSDEVGSELRGLSLKIVKNPDWAVGMGNSIACGARAIPETADGVLVMPCDQWKLQESDLAAMVTTWKSDISQIYIAQWKTEKALVTGSPTIFPGRLIPELKFVDGGRGAKAVVDRNRGLVRPVNLQNAKFDLDEPQDLERLGRS